MASIIHPCLTLLASVTRQKLLQQITYLLAENRILRSKLPDRISLSNQERRKLLRHGKKWGARIKDLISIVSCSSSWRCLLGFERTRFTIQVTLSETKAHLFADDRFFFRFHSFGYSTSLARFREPLRVRGMLVQWHLPCWIGIACHTTRTWCAVELRSRAIGALRLKDLDRNRSMGVWIDPFIYSTHSTGADQSFQVETVKLFSNELG